MVQSIPPSRWGRAAAMLLGLAVGSATAGAAEPGVPPLQCIGDDRLPVPAGGPRAWLDARDRAEVSAALQARFPVLQRDGLEPKAMLLWRHAAGDWRYAALVADPRQAGELCVAAGAAGQAIGGTDDLVRKYFPAALR